MVTTRHRKTRIWILSLSTFVIILGVTAFLGRQSIADWRYNANLEGSKKFAAEGNLKRASQLAGAALQLRPNSVEALRLLFEHARKFDRAGAGELAKRLCLHPETGVDEKAELLTFLLLAENRQGFETVFSQLDQAIRESREIRWVRVLSLTGSGEVEEAREELESLNTEAPEARFQFPLATLLVASSDREDRDRGRSILLDLMKGGVDPEIGLNAVRVVSRLEPEEVDSTLTHAIFQFVFSHEDATTEDKLFAYSLAIREQGNDPERRSELIEAAIADCRDENVGALSRWLFLHGESKRILKNLNREVAKDDLEQYQIYLAALMAEDRWEEAEDWLASPPDSLGPARFEALRATVNSSQGKPADSHWKVALEQAAVDKAGVNFPMICEMALAAGAHDIAAEAMVRWFDSDAPTLPSLAQVAPILVYLSEKGRDRDVLTILERMAEDDPENPSIINGLAYGRILAGVEIPDAVASLEQLRSRFPASVAYRTSLALGYLQLERPSSALAELTREPAISWSDVKEPERAVWAAVLAKIGRDNEATEIRKSIKPENLSPSERALLLN